ncbi:hypothetical protein HDK77DRAFT_84859 [Phyllosticta capitalensis]
MSDIQQWMRKKKKQPASALTPTAPTAPSDLPLRNAPDTRSDSGAPLTTGLQASRATSGAGGPRKKISSYFSANTINPIGRMSSLRSSPSGSKTPATEDPFDCGWPEDENDMVDDSGAGVGDSREAMFEAMDAIQSTLCQNPFEGLPIRLNKSFLALVEWFRNTTYENEHFRERVDALEEKLRETEKNHDDEVAVYKQEIKRLEVIISKGQDGMARLMASRQDSVLRKGNNRRTGRKTETDDGKQGDKGISLLC